MNEHEEHTALSTKQPSVASVWRSRSEKVSLIAIGVILLFVVVSGVYLVIKITHPSKSVNQGVSRQILPIATTTDTVQQEISVSTTTYVNDEYGFSLDYPSNWVQKIVDIQDKEKFINKDIVFSVKFSYLMTEKDKSIQECLLGGNQDKRCSMLLVNYDPKNQQWRNYVHPPNIFIRVSKTKKSLNDWLVSTYKINGSELENYQMGKSIKLDGYEGYFSSIGCCGGIDNAYVVKRGDYIYEFGTNGDDDNIIDKYRSNFHFTQKNQLI